MLYVINLPKDLERKEAITLQLKERNIPFTFIDGITYSNNLGNEHFSNFCNKYCRKPLKGCALAHINVWRSFLASPNKIAVVLEDDVILEKDFTKETLNNLLLYMNQIDYLLIGCMFGCGRNYCYIDKTPMHRFMGVNITTEKVLTPEVYQPKFVTGTQCYIISRLGAQILLDNAKCIKNHIDVHINNLYTSGKLRLATLATPLVKNNWGFESNNASTFKNDVQFCGIPMSYVSTIAIWELWGYPVSIKNTAFILIIFLAFVVYVSSPYFRS